MWKWMSHLKPWRTFSFAEGHVQAHDRLGDVAAGEGVLCTALYPNAAVMDKAGGQGARPTWDDGVGEVSMHALSIVCPLKTH